MLARELTGDLPCLRCRYNLRGLSIRAVCPECGLPVRATLLALIDPRAQELRPIDRPGITAAGLMVWSGAAVLAALAVWATRLNGFLWVLGVDTDVLRRAAQWAPWLIGLSGVGAIVLIRPHRGIARAQSLAAATGVLGYAMLAYVSWVIHARFDRSGPDPFFSPTALVEVRELATLLWLGVAGFIVIALRRSLRLLVARSVLIRSGRVDRQASSSVLAALGISALGTLARLAAQQAGEPTGLIAILGTVLVGVGSMLLTLGLFGVLADCWRIRRVVAGTPLSLSMVVGGPASPSGSANNRP
jgi:hypothetical protein